MIYNNVQLHNVAELIETPDGMLIQRIPETLRLKLNQGAQRVARCCGNTELRFVPLKDRIKLKISASESKISGNVFWGDFQSAMTFEIAPGSTEDIEIDLTAEHWLSTKYLRELPDEIRNRQRFSPEVCRIRFWGGGQALIVQMPEPASVRPPSKAELPDNTILFYGTSISYGERATAPHLTYANICARSLNSDLINLGMPGSAYCEIEMADYIAGMNNWDMAVLALSVNMVSFSLKEFSQRVNYMLETVASTHPEKNIFCITLYTYHDDMIQKLKDNMKYGKPDDYRQALRNAVKDSPHKNLKLIEGGKILKDISGLGSDLIHPGDFGMIEMGEKLSKQIEILS